MPPFLSIRSIIERLRWIESICAHAGLECRRLGKIMVVRLVWVRKEMARNGLPSDFSQATSA